MTGYYPGIYYPGILRDAFAARGIRFGTTTYSGYWRDTAYVNALLSEYGCINAETESKMDKTQPLPEGFDYSANDRITDFARLNNLDLQNHTLYWWSANPAWAAGMDPLTVKRQAMRRCVGMLERYQRAGYVYYACNEVWDADGRPVPSIWAHLPDWWVYALRTCNDYAAGGAIGINGQLVWSDAEKRRTLDVVKAGLVDYVGIQTHLPLMFQAGIDDYLKRQRRFMDELSRYNVKVEITEMDVALPMPVTVEALGWQAKIYAETVRLMLEYPNFCGFHVWGVDDGHSWIPGVKPGHGAGLLLDSRYQPKPAYYAILEALK